MPSDDNARYLHLIRQDCSLPPGTHVVGYCRDSGGEEQDRSVAQQAETIREYCAHHHLVLDKLYLDEARKSSNTDKREGLQEMLFDLRARFKRINDRYRREKATVENPFGVIFWKSNRLGRDSIEAMNIKTDLRLRGITIIDLVTSANTGNPGIDALIEAFQSYQDEQLLNEISENVKRGQAQLVATRDTDPEFLRYNLGWKSTGGYLGVVPGPAPMGFKKEPVQIGVYKRRKGGTGGEPRIVGRLVPDPETWDRCRLAWEMRHQGMTLGKIHEATRLYKTKNNYATFFGNRIYTGDLEFGGRVYENFVPAMIPRDWFEEEQRHKAERTKKYNGQKVKPEYEPRRVGAEYLLSGLVFCGAVDGEEHPMHIGSIPATPGKRGRYVYFMCSVMNNTRGQDCQASRISLKVVEKAVIDNLLDHIITLDNLQPMADELARRLNERTRDADIRIDAVQAKLDDVRQSMDNLLDTIEKMGYAPHLRDRYEERQREETALVTELTTLEALRIQPKQVKYVSEEMLRGWIEHTREVLQGGDRELARQAIRQFVAKIVIKNGTGMLYYTFPLEANLYTPSGQSVDLRRFELLTSTVRL